MKKIILLGFLCIALSRCERNSDEREDFYSATIAGFDLNCSTCILAFPADSLKIKTILGESPGNFYQTVNLDKNDFFAGQRIQVSVRKAKENELRDCVTLFLFPTHDYENIFVTECRYNRDLILNDTIDLACGDCLNDFEKQKAICFDSVLTDSRCPENVVCVWEGDAIARFSINYGYNDPFVFDLHAGTIDTIVNGYKFSFIDLLPYPNTEIQIEPEDYKAKILLRQN